MLEPLAEGAALAWPVALSVATLAVADRARSGRRRRALNQALHELRRPLQALVLTREAPAPRPGAERQLDLALDALEALDREINGSPEPPPRPSAVHGELAVAAALERWREPARLAGRQIGVSWLAGGACVECDPAALARALDNLVANALEHGSGEIALRGEERGGRLLLSVLDGGCERTRPNRRGRDPRRGHGLTTTAAVAAEHGGAFQFVPGTDRTCATIALPLAR